MQWSLQGDYLLVTSWDYTNGTDGGFVYIFKKDVNDTFTQIDKITADDIDIGGYSIGDGFGASVSMSGDYILVGSYREDANTSNSGAAYVFKNDGSDNFTQIAKLKSTAPANTDHFGSKVSIEGAYAFVGSTFDDTHGTDSGNVYAYKNDGSDNFIPIGQVYSTDIAAGDNFGYSMTLENGYLVVGAYNHDTNGVSGSGAAYVFKNDGSDNFIQVSKLFSEDSLTINGNFGFSVSIDDNYIVVGASRYSYNPGNWSTGATFIYKNDGTDNFNQVNALYPTPLVSSAYFGYSVGIDDDTLIVGAALENSNRGAGYLQRFIWTS